MGQLFTVLLLELFSHSIVSRGSCSLYFFLSYSVTGLFHKQLFTVIFLELFSLITVSWGSCSLYFFLSYSVSSLFHGAVVHCTFS